MSKKRVFGIILAAIVIAIVAVLGVNYRAVRAVYKNWTVGHLELVDLTPWEGGEALLEVPYAEDSPNQYVDLYIPEGERAPLFVMIHGGGFISNDARSRQARLMLQYFRDHGYACASVNYRLAQEAPFPGALCDCKAAIRYLILNADKYGYDADNFIVWGESAGGYLATMCAVTSDDEFADVRCLGQDDSTPVSTRPGRLVDYYGHIDNRGIHDDWRALGIPEFVVKIANRWLDVEEVRDYEDMESYWARKNISEMTEEEFARMDPYTYLNKNDLAGLKAWIVHGDCDITVPYLHSQRLNDALVQKLGGDSVVYTLVPGMGHASDPLYSDDLLGALDTWLQETGKQTKS